MKPSLWEYPTVADLSMLGERPFSPDGKASPNVGKMPLHCIYKTGKLPSLSSLDYRNEVREETLFCCQFVNLNSSLLWLNCRWDCSNLRLRGYQSCLASRAHDCDGKLWWTRFAKDVNRNLCCYDVMLRTKSTCGLDDSWTIVWKKESNGVGFSSATVR